jgi:methionyl-tRNA synthetase
VAESETVDIDTFGRMDLRVGLVLQAEAVPKSQKLLRLQIDLGEAQPRQILSGIAETVQPADLLGRQVLVIANLPPRKLMGQISHGMLLVAEDATGRRVPLHPARDVPNGSHVK